MKMQLKILTIFALTMPTVGNIIACKKENTNTEISENSNVQELLLNAKEQISLGLGNLIDQYKHLTFEDEFASLGNITNYLNGLSNDLEIRDNVIKNLFLNRLQADINGFIIDKYLMQPPKLKPLFSNIPTNKILNIDINQTILKKVPFNWDKKDDFGIDNYDPKNYSITMWHKITAELKLELTYKNEGNINSTIEIDNNYNFNYANQGANLRSLIDTSTANVESVLDNFLIEIQSTITTDNDWTTKIKETISKKLKNLKVIINKVDMNEELTMLERNRDFIDVNDRRYASSKYMHEAFTKSTIEKGIEPVQNYLTDAVKEFATSLVNWINTNPIAEKITVEKNKINGFGKCTISDWTISGLSLKPMTLDFVNARSDQTQDEWAQQTATALVTIFHPKGMFSQGRIDVATNNNLTIYMNPADFDDFVTNDKKMSDISDYITKKINFKAKKEQNIKNSFKEVGLNGLWVKNPTLSNNKIVQKIDDKTFNIKVEAGGMWGWNYLRINYENTAFIIGCNLYNNRYYYTAFDNWIFKRADTDVW